jgi:hypothetical protein
MKSDNFFMAASIALAVGILQTILLLYLWTCMATYSPVSTWLVSHGVTGLSLRRIVFIVDWLINISLCLPAAYVLCKLRPRKLPVYLIFAVVPSFLWQYRLVFIEPAAFSNFTAFLPGILSAVFMLPVATAIVRLAQLRRSA